MNRNYFRYIIISCLLLFTIKPIVAQDKITIKGNVSEENTEQALVGVNITIKAKLIGTITDVNGDFTLITKTQAPFTLVISIVGYETQEKIFKETRDIPSQLDIVMKEKTMLGQELVISASRIEESILSSAVSIEKMGILDIQQSSSSNFYDGLYQLKGVDMNVNSLTFRFPNTRGFTGESNYRMNQLVDGIDNVSPGLSFAAGNLFGLSELDVESVELLVGASSALYGPGGMNGTLLMTSKNPFEYQGLSFIAQTGLMHVNADYNQNPAPMYDFSIRYAKVLNDKLAFKITGNYLQATDWQASDFRDRTDLNDLSLTRESNPGYDGVNVYGDDIIVPVNLQDVAPTIAETIAETQGYLPGTPEYNDLVQSVEEALPDQVISRTGWDEKHLADYNTTNLRVGGALHYRINENLEVIAQGNYSEGTSLYTTTNRFSVKDFGIGFGKLELKGQDFFLRTWAILEETGGSYDVGGAALRMNEAWKSSEQWYEDYITEFTTMALLGRPEDEAHDWARKIADNRDGDNVLDETVPAFPLPGTDEFNSSFQDITQKPVVDGGAKVIDQSKLWHIEGMYNFSQKLKVVELVVGASHRIYWIDSRGTIFADEPGQPITNYIFGAYTQISKSFWRERFKASASARFDKHEQFDGEFTPRFSMVYSLDPKNEHNIRASYQTAFRFPSTSDQWVDLDIGFYHALGGLSELQNQYDFNTNPVYPLSGSNPITDEPVIADGPFIIPDFGPEKVTALELGYKGLGFHNMLFVDAYVYKNEYTGFLANQLLAQNPFMPNEKRYQTIVSTNELVSSYGWAIGADLNLMRGYYAKGNIAYNQIEDAADQDGRQTRYNTPDYRFNIGLGNRQIVKNIGIHFNYRWQNEFLWESNFGVAQMPAFATLDANVAVKVPKIKSIVKIGGSNLLNNYYTTSFGSAQIGGLYYISLNFDEFLN